MLLPYSDLREEDSCQGLDAHEDILCLIMREYAVWNVPERIPASCCMPLRRFRRKDHFHNSSETRGLHDRDRTKFQALRTSLLHLQTPD